MAAIIIAQELSRNKCATMVYAINAKDIQDDTNALNATINGIHLAPNVAHVRHLNQLDPIKMGMSSKIVSEKNDF